MTKNLTAIYALLLFSTFACKKAENSKVEEETAKIIVIGQVASDDFNGKVFDPPIELTPEEGKQVLEINYSEKRFHHLRITVFEDSIRSANFYENTRIIRINGQAQVLSINVDDTIYFRPNQAIDTVFQFNFLANTLKYLIPNKPSNQRTWESYKPRFQFKEFKYLASLKLTEDLEWKGVDDEDLSHSLFAIARYPKYVGDSVFFLPIVHARKNTLLNYNRRRFIAFRQFIQPDIYNYGWLELKIINPKKVRIYSYGYLEEN